MLTYLQSEIKQSGKSQRLIAAVLETSEARLTKIIQGKVSPTIKEATTLAKELGHQTHGIESLWNGLFRNKE